MLIPRLFWWGDGAWILEVPESFDDEWDWGLVFVSCFSVSDLLFLFESEMVRDGGLGTVEVLLYFVV